MKYLQDSDGNILPLSDDVQIFKRIVLFTTFSISGDFSSDFTIPNNSENRSVLGIYSLMQIERIIQKPFYFFVDGNRISDGRVFVRGIADVIDLFYVAGNGNWMNQIKGKITDIDFSDYDLDFTAASVITNMNTTEGIIFPVVDWAYNYKKLSNYFLASPITGVSVDAFYDFYPCMHAKTILQRIMDYYGLILDGNLLNVQTYNDLVITFDQVRSQEYSSPYTQTEFLGYTQSTYSSTQFSLPATSGSENYQSSSNSIIIPRSSTSGTGTLTLDMKFVTGNPTVRIGVVIAGVTTPDRILFVTVNLLKTYTITFPLPAMSAGTGVFVQLSSLTGGTVSIGGRLDLSIVYPDTSVRTKTLLPDIDQFEFIKYIAQRFNCLIEYDDVAGRVIFTTFDSISLLDAQDITDNVVSYTQVPASGYSENNYIRTEEAAELALYEQNNLKFGDAVIVSDGDGEQDIIKTPFRPAETFVNTQLDWLMTNVPLIKLEDADDGVAYTSVISNSGFARFQNGTLFEDYVQRSIVRIRSDSGVYSGFAVVITATSSGLTVYAPFSSGDTGMIYKQKIVFQNIGSRELLVCRNIDINDINTGSPTYGNINIRVLDSGTTIPIDRISWAFFAKPNINTDLDNFRIGLNYGPVPNTGNVTFGTAFHKNLSKIIKGPHLPTQVLLSQTEFNNLSLIRFVYLRTVDIEGYFFISEFKSGWVNQYTPVELDLIYISNG